MRWLLALPLAFAAQAQAQTTFNAGDCSLYVAITNGAPDRYRDAQPEQLERGHLPGQCRQVFRQDSSTGYSLNVVAHLIPANPSIEDSGGPTYLCHLANTVNWIHAIAASPYGHNLFARFT